MKIVYSDLHQGHDPQFFLVRGKPQPSTEQPERAARLLRGIAGESHRLVAPHDFGMAPIAAIHTPAYLRFLETAQQRWQTLPNPSIEVLPNMHPLPGQPITYPESLVGQAGFHMADTACPIGPGTFTAAVAAAHTGCEAAQLVLDGESAAYALCRPPGHHAYVDRAGGFCYLNNSAIVAQWLRQRHSRVAIIDVDVHHGNGTQGIFWQRADVLTVSLHADPANFYPFFVGYAHERGEGAGLGYNLNVPLALGTGDDDYLLALERAIDTVQAFAPQVIVIALGLDAYENDPLRGLAITTAGFSRIGARLARIGLPTVLVQEGGYLSEELGDNLASALRGFESVR